jgi:amino acid adenylation domain-containing protein
MTGDDGLTESDQLSAVVHAHLTDHAVLTAVHDADGSTVTYHDLLARVEALIAAAYEPHLAPRSAVAVIGRPGLPLYVGVLAAILSGGVPAIIDAAQPAGRIRQTLKLIAPGLVVLGPGIPALMPAGQFPATTEIDSDGRVSRVAAEPVSRPPRPYGPGVGYLGFTSGSRGAPRVIVGSARGLLHFLTWQRERFTIGAGDRFGQLTSPGFDVFYRDLLTPLLSGATLCVPGAAQLGGAGVLGWLVRAGVTHLHTVPSLARYWLRAGRRGPAPDLRTTFFAGEPLPGDLVSAWRAATAAGQRVVNLYGTAEATLAQSCYEVPVDCGDDVQPVGRPLPGVRLRVVDAAGQHCEPGTAGEVMAESPYLSYGYLRSSGTALDAPMAEHRTGDRGFWTASGELRLVGRIDREVKIRGVRVSLDEVAAVLATHPDVDEAVVVTGTDRLGQLILRAHLTTRRAAAPEPAELRSYVGARLPDPMVPVSFEVHAAIRRGPTGKLSAMAFESAAVTDDPGENGER